MSKTASNMIALGTPASTFSLPNVLDNTLYQFNKQNPAAATVIMFICNHCPYVKHINEELSHVANDYSSKEVEFIAINPNDVEKYPQDSPENMVITAQTYHYPFPYLFDESQEVAKAYQAACTPDFYVYDAELKLVYRGQFDESRPGNDIPVTGNSIRQALDAILQNKPLEMEQRPSLGCNIKWKS